MIDVGRDAEGMRKAFEELFEEDFARRRVRRNMPGASEETLARMEATLPVRTLSPGYYTLAHHILALDAERQAGLSLDAQRIAAFEIVCLIALGDARATFNSRHPACTGCGAQQDTQFTPECWKCGAKFRRKGA